MKNQGIYINLVAQLDRLFRHCRQGSIKTRHRYQEAMRRFLVFLAEVFKLEKLSNIQDKHLRAYVAYLIESGKSIAYLKTELSAIRFFVDQIPGYKHQLPSNKELELERRQYGKTDRTWTNQEFDRAVELTVEKGMESYAAVLTLAHFAGLRLHEIFRLGTSDAEKALKTSQLTVKGKGGLQRTLGTTLEIDSELRKLLDVTPRGHKMFVGSDTKTHIAMGRFEDFLYDNRAAIQDPGSTRPLTVHGLRHNFAVEKYLEFIGQGLSPKAARLAVARLLGHGRDEVTKVYLASIYHKHEEESGDMDGGENT